jgi:hypothetical protein
MRRISKTILVLAMSGMFVLLAAAAAFAEVPGVPHWT